MIPSTYEGPRNGDYVSYVDQLLRASPDFRRTQNSIVGAVRQASITPGVQAQSPAAQLKQKLRQAREQVQLAQQAQQAQQAAAASRPAQRVAAAQGSSPSKQEAQQRFRAIEREIESQKAEAKGKSKPWVSPFSIVLIVGGTILSQFVPGIGPIITLMGFMSLIGGVVSRLKGK